MRWFLIKISVIGNDQIQVFLKLSLLVLFWFIYFWELHQKLLRIFLGLERISCRNSWWRETIKDFPKRLFQAFEYEKILFSSSLKAWRFRKTRVIMAQEIIAVKWNLFKKHLRDLNNIILLPKLLKFISDLKGTKSEWQKIKREMKLLKAKNCLQRNVDAK